jgi:multiple sugar transport system substrate-binding protein
VLAAGAGVALAPLFGCGRVLSGKPVLRVANWSGVADESDYQQKIREVYARFEKDFECELQIEGIPDPQEYARKMLLNYVAGSQPDVMQLDASSSAAFIDNGILRDLTPYVEQDQEFTFDDFWPNVVDIARRGGGSSRAGLETRTTTGVYAVPLGFTPMVLYYNRSLFVANGGPGVPTDGMTFDHFLEVAKYATLQGQYGFKFISWMPGWIMWLWNNGGEVLSPDGMRATGFLDSDQNVEAITFLRDLVSKHKVAPSLSQASAAGVDPFTDGTSAMEVSGHWAMVGYAKAPKLNLEEIGVVSLPTNTGTSQTVMYESGLSIGKHCKHPDLAWEFVKYMTSASVQRTYNSTGIEICARKDIAAENGTTEREKKFLEIVPSARGPWGARVQGYDFVEAEGQAMMDNILKVGAEVRPALEQMARRVDAFFAQR